MCSPLDFWFLLALTCKKLCWWFCPSVFTKQEWLKCLNAARLAMKFAVIFWPSGVFIFPKVQSINIFGLRWEWPCHHKQGSEQKHCKVNAHTETNEQKSYLELPPAVLFVLIPIRQSKARRKWKTISNIKSSITIYWRQKSWVFYGYKVYHVYPDVRYFALSCVE